MTKHITRIALMLALAVLMSASAVRADQWDRKMVLTFSQLVEIPGHVLPAGTYIFKLADSLSDRHIVRIFNGDESRLVATVIAIPRRRETPSDERIVTFREVPAGSPEIILAWFYPGSDLGQEFVYPKRRATQLAAIAKAPVPAIAVDTVEVETADLDTLKTAPIVAISPDATEAPIALSMPAGRVENAVMAPMAGASQSAPQAGQLPRTAGALPLIALLGVVSLSIAFGLLMRGRPAAAFAKV